MLDLVYIIDLPFLLLFGLFLILLHQMSKDLNNFLLKKKILVKVELKMLLKD